MKNNLEGNGIPAGTLDRAFAVERCGMVGILHALQDNHIQPPKELTND